MTDKPRERTVAFALGGLAGNNAHGAGFLYGAARHHLEPRMISCTSGQIYWVYRYLQARQDGSDLREVFRKELEELNQFHNVNLDYARLALFGKPGIFRPASIEYPQDLLINAMKAYVDTLVHAGNVFQLEELLHVFPGRLLVPQFTEEFLTGISHTLNTTGIGIAFNSYSPAEGLEYVFLNDEARELLSPSGRSYQRGQKSHVRGDTTYQAITPESVRDALWIYEYGFDKESKFVDGAYYRQIMLSELTVADTIYVARPINRRWLGETAGTGTGGAKSSADLPRSYIGIQDLKTVVNFNGSYIGEKAQIELINKIVHDRAADRSEHPDVAAGLLETYHPIALVEVEIQRPRGFFDFVFESLDVFDDAARALDANPAPASVPAPAGSVT
jgi:hypothetical protein